MSEQPHSDAFVLFGATGDLAFKKIFLAIHSMIKRGSPDAELGEPIRLGRHGRPRHSRHPEYHGERLRRCFLRACALVSLASSGCQSDACVLPAEPKHVEGCQSRALVEQALEPGTLIAHALGGIAGLDKTNTREALEESLEEGKIWYEVDIGRARDGVLVCVHPSHLQNYSCERDAATAVADTDSADFIDERYAGRFTPMLFEDVLVAMEEHPEIHVITDTRGWDAELVSSLTSLLTAHPETAARLIPQIYRPAEAAIIEAAGEAWPFPFEIMTLYLWTEDADEVLAALPGLPGVLVVTMYDHVVDADFSARLHDRGLIVGTHTINDADQAAALASNGADVFYTDTLCGPSL